MIIYFFYISLFIRKLAISFNSKEIVASIRDSIITQYSVMPIPYIYNDTNYSMHISLVIQNYQIKIKQNRDMNHAYSDICFLYWYWFIKALDIPHSTALIALHAFHKFSLGVNKLTTRRHRGMDTEITWFSIRPVGPLLLPLPDINLKSINKTSQA